MKANYEDLVHELHVKDSTQLYSPGKPDIAVS